MPYIRHFFVEGKLIATAEVGKQAVQGAFYPPRSYAYFCPVCAEVWARCPVEGGQTDFHAWTRNCRKHGGGLLMLPLQPEYSKELPLEVLRWELERHCELYEKGITTWTTL